jgi:putative ABC transport system ATP-binding protein
MAAVELMRLSAVTKVFGAGGARVVALRGVDLTIHRGDFVAILGASGSGKSTAMNILGCLDTPSTGTYEIDGVSVEHLAPEVLAALRLSRFGFVFQGFNLLPRTSAQANVELPLVYAGIGKRERMARGCAALAAVGLRGRETARPNELSGGQQQRVAIARALVNHPQVVLADEPTGNLDSRTSAEIMDLLAALHRDHGQTVVMVTHEPDVAAYAPRHVLFHDGRIVFDGPREELAARRKSGLVESGLSAQTRRTG